MLKYIPIVCSHDIYLQVFYRVFDLLFANHLFYVFHQTAQVRLFVRFCQSIRIQFKVISKLL